MVSLSEDVKRVNAERGHLCVGIDPRPEAFPAEYDEPAGFQQWCLDLVEATSEHAAAFKPNLAFFLQMGPPGIEALEATVDAAKRTGALTLLDAKFADIGSTATAYARFAREVVGADAVTLNPYMGTDVLDPFLDEGLGVFVLARTTNPSAVKIQGGVAGRVIQLFAVRGAGFVAPGNDPEVVRGVRQSAGDAPLLLPGIGAQGGHADLAAQAASGGPFLVNVSRGISQAEGSFPEAAAKAAAGFADQLGPP